MIFFKTLTKALGFGVFVTVLLEVFNVLVKYELISFVSLAFGLNLIVSIIACLSGWV